MDVNTTEFDDFVSGKVVIIKSEQQSKRINQKCIENDPDSACVAIDKTSRCARFTNPFTGDTETVVIRVHAISSTGFCVKCYQNRTGTPNPTTNCTSDKLMCLCADLTTWQKLVDCKINGSTDNPIIPTTNNRQKESTIVQTMTYTVNEDERKITIQSPAEGVLEATDVLMYADNSHKRYEYLVKFGNICQILRLSSLPVDIAIGIHEIKNITEAGEDDLEEHVILLTADVVGAYPVKDTYGLEDNCIESTVKNMKVKSISKEQGDDLKMGNVIFFLPSVSSSQCDLKIAVKRQISGGWRFPSKSDKPWVHLNIHLVQSITSCQNPESNPTCCQQNQPGIWETKNIQPETFELLLEQSPTKKALFAAGGEDSNIMNSVEILTEDDSGQFTSRQVYVKGKGCTGVPDLPIATTSGTGAMFNNQPNVCTGYTGEDQHNQCFELEVTGSWNNHFNWTSSIAYGVSSVVFHNINYESAVIDNMWLHLPDKNGFEVWAGEPPSLISDEIGIIRPTRTSYPCVTKISDHEAFVYSQPKFARIFNIESNTWTNLPSTIESRSGPACGFLKTPSGTKYVVLAGGDSSSTTEMLNLNTNEWTSGPNLEDNLFGGRMVSIGDYEELLFVGGYSTKPLSNIRKLDLEKNSWETVGHLTNPRFNAAAFSVPLQGLPTLCP